MRLFCKPQYSVSTTHTVAYLSLQFSTSAKESDAIDTMNAMKNEGKIPQSFVPVAGLEKSELARKDGSGSFFKAAINLRSDDPALVERLRADSSVRKMDTLETAAAEPTGEAGY